MFASRAIAASDQAVLEVSAQEMETLKRSLARGLGKRGQLRHPELLARPRKRSTKIISNTEVVNLEIILRDSLVDILRAPHSIPGLKANTLLASLFTDGRRYDAGHTGLPGMRPLPGSV